MTPEPANHAPADQAPATMVIDIYSDVVCPWCAIGYGQLSRALDELEGEIEAQIRWRPFELNPDMPDKGEGFDERIARKYGRSREQSADMRDQMKAIAEKAGVSLSFEGKGDPPPQRMWNTHDCHKLLAFALDEAGSEAQTALKLALFKAHFNERKPLSDRTVLLDIAADAGLHREAAKAALDSEELSARVRAEEAEAFDHNITGVPAVIIDGKFMIPGAQEPQTYIHSLRRILSKRSQAAQRSF